MKKLAITISGAVSLGAYEAGVMYELLQALAAHNAADPANAITIDVLTGASAGGMTAVILAQKLLFQSDRLRLVNDNDLYLPWVKDVDLLPLLNLNADEPSMESILSSDLIENISIRYLITPYAAGINRQNSAPHPAAAPRIKLGLAMSNLNGVDYVLQLASGGTLPYTRFQDEVKLDVDSGNPQHVTADFWEPIRNAAVACGAFPFAFRVKELQRQASDYPADPPPQFPPTGMNFAYTDGGVFQNEPIGLAKQLVDEIDQHVFEQRYYIYVAPQMRSAAGNDFTAAPGFSYFNFWNTGMTLVNAIFNQARYRDLQNVEKINSQVAAFDQQAAGLKDLFLARTLTAASMAPATHALLEKFFPGGAAPKLNDEGEDARARLRKQYAAEYGDLTAKLDAADADAWIDAVLLLESVASLGPKDQMTVFAITQSPEKLAGDALYAFAGFFDVAYRQHDYDRGRQSARDFITQLNQDSRCADPANFLGPIQYDISAQPPITVDASLDDLCIAAMDQSKRQALRDRLYGRIQDFLDEAGLSWVAKEAVDIAYLNGFLNKMLGL